MKKNTTKQKVALVLASGGAKGFAHIGVIEELESQGFEITSVAGTSMGALIGGIYAAGGLDTVKKWMFELTRKEVLHNVDLTLSPHALIKGDRIIHTLQDLVPDQPIESLKIPFSASATDLVTGKEVVFTQGSLFEAIRASISIPMLFEPIEKDGMLLVDGGITNGLPLDRVKRTEGDILVAINLDDYSWDSSEFELDILKKHPKIKNSTPVKKIRKGITALNTNYVTMADAMISILMRKNMELAMQITPPDIYLNVDLGEYGSYDYDKAEAVAQCGRDQIKAKIEEYFEKNPR